MEAGRYSKPVIGRDIPVLQELIGRNRAGLLVGKTTSEHACYAAVTPVELARAVLKLLQDKSLRRELGENCHRVSEQFTWPHIVQRFEASYITAKKNKSCTP